MKSNRAFHALATLVALLCFASPALGQNQPAPAAKTTSGVVTTTPSSIFVAPSGGVSGLGTVVAPDAPLPVTCITGCSGGGAGAAATASASALPVVAGTDKPQNIDLFSQTRVLVGDDSGNPIDWAAAVPITGVNGTTVATAVNPFPVSGPVVVTADGTSTTGIAPASSTAAESCRVLKASAGNVYSVSGYIGAAGFLMLFDATSAPADGAVTPKAWAYAPAAGSWSMSYGSIPAVMATGITVCASSTGPLTKTAYSTNTVFSGNVK